jgi:hypothetical protein
VPLKSQLEKLHARVHGSLPTGALRRRLAEAVALRDYGCLAAEISAKTPITSAMFIAFTAGSARRHFAPPDIALKAVGAAADSGPLDNHGSAFRLSWLRKSDSIDVSFYRGDWRKFSDVNCKSHAGRAGEITNLFATAPRERRKRHEIGMA